MKWATAEFAMARCVAAVAQNQVGGEVIVFSTWVGPARFERRPTIGNRRDIMVGRRGEASGCRSTPIKAVALVERQARPPSLKCRID